MFSVHTKTKKHCSSLVKWYNLRTTCSNLTLHTFIVPHGPVLFLYGGCLLLLLYIEVLGTEANVNVIAKDVIASVHTNHWKGLQTFSCRCHGLSYPCANHNHRIMNSRNYCERNCRCCI